MIISENIEIKLHSTPTTELIETALATKGINPLRWAIVKVSGNSLTVSVAYDKIGIS